ncbi:MAG: fold metallo-hydrolase [Conexibacter sp.]|nr:fold metallo-hydrolase [Conexibacter sp.]
MSDAAVAELAPGLHRWTARHPRWHPAGDFGARVASFALVAGDDLLLIDPQLPEDGAVVAALDALADTTKNVHVLLTIGYHVRSAEPLGERYDAQIHGPETVASRLQSTARFTPLDAGAPGPAGVVVHAIGRPRRSETPLWLPSHEAIAFGDALVTTPAGALRMWCQDDRDDRRLAFYRDRFAPTLEPLVARNPRRILVTHGAPILADGAAHLQAAAAAEPWFHRG